MSHGAARVAWIDYAKGICLVAVVALYATNYVEGVVLKAGWMTDVILFARPFRMPAFFLVAGLFLARTIDQPWREYADKKILHFAYFFVLWTTIYFIAGLLKGEFAGSPSLWREYLDWYVEPFHMLWFIQMLAVYFLVARLVRRLPWVAVLLAAAALQIWEPDSGWRQLDRFGERFVYFYAGYIGAPLFFRIAAWARDNRLAALTVLASWGIINQLFVLAERADDRGIALALGFSGAAAVIGGASLLSRWRAMDWLRTIGENSLVVFLAFFLVTVGVTRLFAAIGMIGNPGVWSVALTAISVAGPLVFYRLTRHTPLRFLFVRPRWARLATAPRVTVAPQAAVGPGAIAAAVAPLMSRDPTAKPPV